MLASQLSFEVTDALPGGRRRRAERSDDLPVVPAVGLKRHGRPAPPHVRVVLRQIRDQLERETLAPGDSQSDTLGRQAGHRVS